MKKKSSKAFYKNVVFNIVMVAMFILSIFFLIDIYQEIIITLDLRKQLDLIEERYNIIVQENEALQDQKGRLNNPDYVKNYARAGFMLSREGEQIFFLPQQRNND